MDKPTPILPYQSPKQTARRIHPILWWSIGDAFLGIALVVAVFAIEPERVIDPPASRTAEAFLTVIAVAWFGLTAGIGVWAFRIWWKRHRVE